MVPLQIPDYLALGQPTDEYPPAWSVLGWIEGEDATPTTLSDLNHPAERLGRFVLAMRAVGTEGAPDGNNRGKGLARMDADARHFRSMFSDDIDRAHVLWQQENMSPTLYHPTIARRNNRARVRSLIAECQPVDLFAQPSRITHK